MIEGLFSLLSLPRAIYTIYHYTTENTRGCVYTLLLYESGTDRPPSKSKSKSHRGAISACLAWSLKLMGNEASVDACKMQSNQSVVVVVVVAVDVLKAIARAAVSLITA